MTQGSDTTADAADWRAPFEAMGVRRSLAAGDVLISEGDTSQSVFLVAAGDLDVVLVRGGVETLVERCVVGELVGEVAALAGTARSATVRAAGPAQVVELDQHGFQAWLGVHPSEAATIAAAARRHLHRVQVSTMALEVLGASARPLVPHLLELAEWIDLDAGSTLFEEGDPPDAAYFVLEGRLQVCRRAPLGGDPGEHVEQVVGEIGRGEVVGETAIILEAPRSATVRALRDTSLARFDLGAVEALLTSEPQLMLMIVRRMVRRIGGERTARPSARSVAVIVTSPDVRDAVAAAMVEELQRQGSSAFLSSERIDAELGRGGSAQVPATDVRSARLDQHLSELEATCEFMLLLADPQPSEWTRRALQRADCVVTVASARPGAEELRALGAASEATAHVRAPRWLALLHSSSADRPLAAWSFPHRARFDEVHHLRHGRASDLARVTRLAMGVGTGVVLGGGGARGFAHLGVLRALRELGVPVDRIGGASMGSIFAAIAALHPDQDDLAQVVGERFTRLLDYTVPVVSLLKAKRIAANLEAIFDDVDTEDTWVPFFCVSTNLTRSRLEVHRRGRLITAIRASIAIPGVLPPLPLGDDLLVDGGVLNNVPADVMRADPSIGTVIAVDVAPKAGPAAAVDYGMYLSGWQALRRMRRRDATYPGLASVLVRTMITGSEGRRTQIREGGVADLYLELDISGVGLLEFGAFDAVTRRGYEQARPLIRAWLDGRAVRTGAGASPGIDDQVIR